MRFLALFLAFSIGLLVNVSPALAGGSAIDRLRQRISDLRQQRDNADQEISRITRSLANAASPQTITELNRQLRDQQKRRSDALFGIYQAEQEIRRIEQARKALKADQDAYVRAVGQYQADRRRNNQAIQNHNNDVRRFKDTDRRYSDAVRRYNALPRNRRSRAEYNRLNNWNASLNNWQSAINGRMRRLNAEKARLDNRLAELRRWGRSLFNRERELQGRR